MIGAYGVKSDASDVTPYYSASAALSGTVIESDVTDVTVKNSGDTKLMGVIWLFWCIDGYLGPMARAYQMRGKAPRSAKASYPDALP